jgi:predicted nucleotidyltransferase
VYEVNKSIVNDVRHYLKTVNENGIRVSFGVIFGSHTRGEATAESDIDVMVVSPDFDGKRKLDDVGRLWHFASQTEANIEPIPCGEVQWRENESSPIIEVARQQGQIIRLAEEG